MGSHQIFLIPLVAIIQIKHLISYSRLKAVVPLKKKKERAISK